MKITALRCQQPFPSAQRRQKSQIPAGLPRSGNFNRLPFCPPEIGRQRPEFGGSELVLTWVGENSNSARLINPANHLRQFRPVGFYVTGLAVAQITLERLRGVTHDTLASQDRGKMRTARDIAARSSGCLLQQIIDAKLAQPFGNHPCPGPAILVLLRQGALESSIVRIEIQPNNMNGKAFPEAGQFHPGNQGDTMLPRRIPGFGEPGNGVMIGQCKVADTALGCALKQRRR